ncbi:MAG TPA: glutathione synthase, partial [Gammaproteobacteria bacterium]|nr:glutathione synthase [Gammaproteobacteria bacterium]
FIMDPLAGIKPHKDTSWFLMLAARQRGHEVFHLEPSDLSLDNAQLLGRVTPLEISVEQPFVAGNPHLLAMDNMDVVFVRTDPPFDRRYFYTTLLLDFLPATTRVINRPEGVRNWNEKLAALHYAHLGPKTLISRDHTQILQFIRETGRTTIKPVDGFGGHNIFFLQPGQTDATAILGRLTHNQQRWIVAQAYVPQARLGDKRILLLDGEPLGGILRVAAQGSEINNLDAGGHAEPLDLTTQDLSICAALKTGLTEQGIFFAGIDVLGDKLIEINVTSPTGLQELSRFQDEPFHHRIIEALEPR